MKIIEQYLVKTEYGLNLLVLTDTEEYYQQIHHTLCYDGGGVARWVKVESTQAINMIKDK